METMWGTQEAALELSTLHSILDCVYAFILPLFVCYFNLHPIYSKKKYMVIVITRLLSVRCEYYTSLCTHTIMYGGPEAAGSSLVCNQMYGCQ